MNTWKMTATLALALAACATPEINQDDTSVPAMTERLSSELATLVSTTHCEVVACTASRMRPNHFVCTGEYSFIPPSSAQEIFIKAIRSSIGDAESIDFTADEGLGSILLGAFLRGAAAGAAAGATGGSNPLYYAGASSSAIIQFSLPEAPGQP